MKSTFYHCGDIGDIIFSLPVVRAMGGGTLYLDTSGGQHLDLVRQTTIKGRFRFNQSAFDYIAPLIAAQPYIKKVTPWAGEKVDVALVEARNIFDPRHNLIRHYTDWFALPYEISDEPWIQAPPDPRHKDSIVISRTLRYQSSYPWLNGFLHECLASNQNLVFLGLPFEHQVFEETFDTKIPLLSVRCALQSASVIAGCRRFVTNQGAHHAIAIAMNKNPLVVELQKGERVCVFPNRRVQYV